MYLAVTNPLKPYQMQYFAERRILHSLTAPLHSCVPVMFWGHTAAGFPTRQEERYQARRPTFGVRGGCRRRVWHRLSGCWRGGCGCFRRRSLRRNRDRCRCFRRRSRGCERGQHGCFRRGRHRGKRGRSCETSDWQVFSGKAELHRRRNHELIYVLLLVMAWIGSTH